MTSNWPAYYPPPGYGYLPPPPPAPRSVRTSMGLAITAGVLFLSVAGLVCMIAFAFNDSGSLDGIQWLILLVMLPGALMASLLISGANRLRRRLYQGRLMLTGAAAIDLAAGVALAATVGDDLLQVSNLWAAAWLLVL